jgi:hypothetical protein
VVRELIVEEPALEASGGDGTRTLIRTGRFASASTACPALLELTAMPARPKHLDEPPLD